ncbi:MAG: T9SS type A sorting domain-containing protein [Chitinophagales bacterium]|nr:T9SS type A sorting domain-containing protein [Chitinophagales bacterium]
MIPQDGPYGGPFSSFLQPNDDLLISKSDGNSILVFRYLYNGNIDSTFGNLGVGQIDSISSYGEFPIRLQNDGKILIAGNDESSLMVSRLFGEGTVSITDINNNIAFNIFPNPTSDLLTITTTKTLNNRVTITITDISGKILSEQKENFLNGNCSIDVSAFSQGIYLMNILSEKNSYAAKFVKE